MTNLNLRLPKISCFHFYDTETSGTSTAYDQIYQYASIKTDSALQIDPSSILELLCKPRVDVVPHPMAFLTHNIDIDMLKSKGMNEFDFARAVHNDIMGSGNTCVTGYNTSSFDNEMLRNLFYRNMKSLYEHEYSGGNFLFDIYKLVQLTYALRPEILSWPKNSDGKDSLKLDLLATENGIIHENAHDAISDVLATIEIARIIKDKNPKLFDWCLKLSVKDNIFQMVRSQSPLIHVDSKKGKDIRMTSVVYPVVADHLDGNKFYMFDLKHSPEEIMDMRPEDIHKYMFTKRSELPEGSPIIPICDIKANKQPLIAPLSRQLLTDSVAEAASIDYSRCIENLAKVKGNVELSRKIQNAFSNQREFEIADTYQGIYRGFFDRSDDRMRASMQLKVRAGSEMLNIEECQVHQEALSSSDYSRNFDLLLRGKWNSFYESLLSKNFSSNELKDWVDYLENRLSGSISDSALSVDGYESEVSSIMLMTPPDKEGLEVLKKVSAHLEELGRFVVDMRELSDSMEDEQCLESQTNKSIEAIRSRIEIFRFRSEKSLHKKNSSVQSVDLNESAMSI